MVSRGETRGGAGSGEVEVGGTVRFEVCRSWIFRSSVVWKLLKHLANTLGIA
jgi:hypothetical protein